nr:thermonuclease family protein [Actinomycetota bacterium]
MRRGLWLCLVLAVACSRHAVLLGVQAPATFHLEPPGYEDAVVTRVIDGDTVEVEVTARAEGPGAGSTAVGQSYDVRLTGIDTPESVDPRGPVECFGEEASAALEALVG